MLFRYSVYSYYVVACGNDTPATQTGTEETVSTTEEKGAEIEAQTAEMQAATSENEATAVESKASSTNTDKTYKTIEWTELIPAKELEALMNPPDYLNDIEDGSIEDQIAGQIKAQLEIDENDPYQQALVSTNVIAEMDGQSVRMAGFVVPLEFNDETFTVTQFFLVPFFGACIHVPPPPPNQIIFVNYPKGFTLKSIQDPFWVSGDLIVTLTENETATSAYSMELDLIEPYGY